MADAKKLQCAIVTPEAKAFEGPVDFVALPAHDGEIGILPDRAPLLCKLGIGVLRIRKDDQIQRWFVDGGFAQVVDNRLTVLSQQAMRADAVDRAAAERALDEARHMKGTDDAARASRNAAIARARAKLKLALPG